MSNATNRRKSLHRITPKQAIALDCLDSGGTHAEAADAAGVDRTTVSRWSTKHPAFVAELNRRRHERSAELSRTMQEVHLSAIEAVAEGIRKGDTDIAMKWLVRFGDSLVQRVTAGGLSSRQVVEERRRALPSENDPLALLDEMDGRTVSRAEEEILRELGGE